MKAFHHSCQGESHIATYKVCQDASYSAVSDSLSIAIVCDGHGGARYFRSDIGAQLAIEVTKHCVATFIQQVGDEILKGKSFTRKQAISSEAKTNVFTKDTLVDKTLRQLFASIIFGWRQQVAQHAQQNPLTESERLSVEPRFQQEFIAGISIEKTYGCTLMCYVATSDYWFAFQVGDGKCVAFQEDGNWSEPIPWDDNCFLNKTTSLCDSSALEEFRYCYCGDGTFPLAIFLGSDGIDDSFGETENMVNFYIQVLKLIVNEGGEQALQTITETLPQLSKIGSKDDMSVACVYEDTSLVEHIKYLIDWQRRYVGSAIGKVNVRIYQLQNKLRKLEAEGLDLPKRKIAYQYAQKDLARAVEERRVLVEKWYLFFKRNLF